MLLCYTFDRQIFRTLETNSCSLVDSGLYYRLIIKSGPHFSTKLTQHLWTLQQQDLAVDHAVADHPPEDGGLRANGADAVGPRLHQRLLVDIVEVAERLIHLLPQLSGVTVKLRRLHLTKQKKPGLNISI